jgi:PBP4 family serine-type D-alanyl-D-alanine carboxypeptidase
VNDDHPPVAAHPRRTVLTAGLTTGAGLALAHGARAAQPRPAALPESIQTVLAQPRYATAAWSLLVVDLASGADLLALDADRQAFTGSTRKLFSVGLALRQLGRDHRLTTPVYRTGAVGADGVLAGDLVLVGAGDLTLGGRQRPDRSIEYTDFDHNDANNLGTAILTPQSPLLGLDTLARQVAAAGIRHVAGDVLVDDRLFQVFRVPNGNLLITPVLVNENMVDVTVIPGAVGQPATITYRPHTSAFAVGGWVETTAAGTADTVTLSGDALIECSGSPGCAGVVSGTIPTGYRAPLSGGPELVQVFRVEQPATFARIALIDALGRQGVSVAAPRVAPNRQAALPALVAYEPGRRVAEFHSPHYWQQARLILKVSLNLGANLALMLYGLTQGARTVGDALAAERRTLVYEAGINGDSFDFPTNGSGSPDSRATPRAMVQLLAMMAASEVGDVFRECLPVQGVDGSLAGVGRTLPARGHVWAKTGTTVIGGRLIAQNLAGYINARSGRRLAFALFANNVGAIESIADVEHVMRDQAAITNAIYELN